MIYLLKKLKYYISRKTYDTQKTHINNFIQILI